MNTSTPVARLLIIDDELLVRTMAAESLLAAGFAVTEAGDGATGLAEVEACRPELVLLDVMMPGMDGYEVCRALRALPATSRIPVIMLTGLDDTESIERAYESGATDFITKPISASLLTHRVRYALRASRVLDEVDRHRASLANAQRIARLGSWVWEPASASFECSEEYRKIIGERCPAWCFEWKDLLRCVHPGDAERVAEAIDAAIASDAPYAILYRILRSDGAERTVHEQAEVFRDDDGRIRRVEGTTQDVTERVEIEERMRQLADYDALTGLPNRKLFGEVMQHGLNGSRRRMAKAAVLDINLDRFKRINETMGHSVGDRILKEVTGRIAESIRASDLVGVTQGSARTNVFARMSGDDFAVFLSEVRHAEDVALIARRVIAAIARPIDVGGQELTITASIGIAVHPDNGEEPETLLKNAETAMHGAKERGSGTYCFFTPQMNSQALAKLQTETDLRRAIERDELLLFYQARVDAPSGKVIGAEALVRWQHPQRGLVPPNEFIPVAEESGLIIPLTEWVLRAACRQLRQWQEAGLPVVPLSINFSSHSFREEGLAECIAASLREFGIAAAMVEGEITESVLMQDVERTVTLLNGLKDMGIGLSVDDFGTGYSSLAYLKRFPLNVLKIDRAFVTDILTESHDAAIASAVITLGEAMGLAVVAEGIERVEQANFLLALGCRLMQGFLFSRPVPAVTFTQILAGGLAMPAGLRVPVGARAAAAHSLVPRLVHSELGGTPLAY